MSRILGRAGASVAAAALALLGGVGTAAADPSNAPAAFEVPLDCDNGASYLVTVMEQGPHAFSPAHDTASNTTLVPTWFGEQQFVITTDDGTVVPAEPEPEIAKGSSTKDRSTSVSCTFTFDVTFTDPDLGVLHVHGTGSVIGFTTPAR